MTMVFVAGFVDIISYPKCDKSLFLNPIHLTKFLPLEDPIPLNVEHLSEAEVGWTLGLHQVNYGLFCVGVITSVDFLNLLEKLFLNSSVAQTRDSTLVPSPKIEMLHTWLPELSLSSMHPDFIPQAGGCDQAFQHVSICAMGRRRGTIAIYGPDVSWILNKFTSISKHERDKILKSYEDIDLTKLGNPNFTIQPEILMAKAIDASFIKHRLEILKNDKGVADVRNALYLKASVQATESQSHSEIPETCSYELHPKVIEENKMNPPVPQNMGHQTDDLISLPKSTFMNMLQTNIESVRNVTARQPSFQFHNDTIPSHIHTQYPQMGNIYYPHPAPPIHMMPYTKPPGHFQTEFPIYPQNTLHTPWPYDHEMEDEGRGRFFRGQYIPAPYPSRSGKRKRDYEDTDYPVFPGEENNLYKNVLNITKNISELQNEIKDLKNVAMGQKPEFIPTSSNWHYIPTPGPINGQPQILPYHMGTMVPITQNQHSTPFQTNTPSIIQQADTQHAQCHTVSENNGPMDQNKLEHQPPQQPCNPPVQHVPQIVYNSKDDTKPAKGSKAPCVNASSKTENVSHLQKMFCEELLNKQ